MHPFYNDIQLQPESSGEEEEEQDSEESADRQSGEKEEEAAAPRTGQMVGSCRSLKIA